MQYLKIFLLSLAAFALFDFVWLGLLSPKFYDEQFGGLALRDGAGKIKFRWEFAIGAYLLLALGIAVFIIPLFAGQPITWKVFAVGALFGLIVYGVYDFTNAATLAHWGWKLLLVDTLWGMFAYGGSSLIVAIICKKMGII
jgi:uncharacterized membrane protein